MGDGSTTNAGFRRKMSQEYVEIRYTVPLDKLSSGELRQLLEARGLPEGAKRRLSHEELEGLVRALGVDGLTLRGRDAIDARAREMCAVLSRLDRDIAFLPGANLGLELKQVGEWAVVLATPSEMESKVRIGDVLARVNGANALLKSYEDMFQMVCEVKASRVPFSLTFRRAPFHRGWLFKRKRAKAPGLRAASLFSGATGWKRRFFVLAYGVLAYYDAPPEDAAKTPKGFFALEPGRDKKARQLPLSVAVHSFRRS